MGETPPLHPSRLHMGVCELYLFIYFGPGIDSPALYVLGKHSTTELCPRLHSLLTFYFEMWPY